jgi:hypothetical protein
MTVIIFNRTGKKYINQKILYFVFLILVFGFWFSEVFFNDRPIRDLPHLPNP